MQLTLNISLPGSWQELTDTQLRFVFHLLAQNYTATQVKIHCLVKWAHLKIIRSEGHIVIVQYDGQYYTLSSEKIAYAISTMTWLDDIPHYPTRIRVINGHDALRADLQGLNFGDFLSLDNMYQGYLQTQKPDLIVGMARILYSCSDISLTREEEISVFYWFASIKEMFAGMFRHFLKKVHTEEGVSNLPSFKQLQESMNAQIRALTNGDITKEEAVLSMDCWRALTELDAKAKDYEDMQKHFKNH